MMEAVSRVEGVVAVMDRPDIDTDQIIPKQFLKRIERSGYGQFLFHDWRTRSDGSPDPDFVLNRPPFHQARILVAGRNFGCGSSREHAAWALHDFGIRAVIAPSFADIFLSNCFQTGIIPVVLPEADVRQLMDAVAAAATDQEDCGPDRPAVEVTVDLERMAVDRIGSAPSPFTIDPHRRRCLMEGLSDIDLTLEREADIQAWEAARSRPSWV